MSTLYRNRIHPATAFLMGALAAYGIGYGIARLTVLYTVEADPGNIAELQQHSITKQGDAPGDSWEYKFFLPAIKIEETIRNFIDK